MSSRARSRPLAILTVVGCVATAGYMYVAGAQIKEAAAGTSIYKEGRSPIDLRANESDARMGSSAVRAAVQGDRNPKA